MAIQFINTGSSPNAGNGDTLRSAFNKINSNFVQIVNSLTNILTTGTAGGLNPGTQGSLVYYGQNGTIGSELASLKWFSNEETLEIGNLNFTATSIRQVVNSYSQDNKPSVSLQQFHETPDVNNFVFIRGRGNSNQPNNITVGDQIADIVFSAINNSTTNLTLGLTVEIVNTSTTQPQSDLIIFTNSGTTATQTVRLTSTGSWNINKLAANTPGSDITVYAGLMPSVDSTHDLGSTTTQWRNLYLGTGTIYVNGAPLSSGLEIDGGTAFTDYTAEIDVDGGGA